MKSRMYQMYIGFCVIVSLFHGCSAHIYEEGKPVKVYCDPGVSGTMIFWFQINNDGAKFLFTSRNKDLRVKETEHTVNLNDKASLTIESFKKKTDSGVYTCAVINSNKLIFGKPTVVEGKPDPTTQPPKIITTPKPDIMTTAKPQCQCKETGVFESKTRLNCETWILSSLISGCALLLILLNITIFHCNRLRKRRGSNKKPPADQTELTDTTFYDQ